MLTRPELGTLLHNWHASSFDPIEALSSYYLGDMVYPDKDLVEECIESLSLDLNKWQGALKGEKVKGMTPFGFVDDMVMANGLTDEQVKEALEELMVMIASLREYVQLDYPAVH